uniref:Laminin subunit alpha 2 n=1 Tax=Cyclopterus lumpus TaxID=8103 RepID=A0A8C3AV95_CYCLU
MDFIQFLGPEGYNAVKKRRENNFIKGYISLILLLIVAMVFPHRNVTHKLKLFTIIKVLIKQLIFPPHPRISLSLSLSLCVCVCVCVCTEQHPIEYATDGTNRWWQSPSIKNGMMYHYVTITLDLKQVFQIAYMILKAANSPRPGNWVLERSIDGVTFDPWQYYAITDTECLTRFNINPRTGTPSYTRDDEVICTSYYSKIHPLENGEIHTSLINGRPSAADPSPTLLNFTSARYIRLVFQRIRTLNADLMTLTLHDTKDMDPIYYYSIKDISIGGMCICYGHAKACPLDTATKKFSCECEHNTCGESCDHCCPGYHQQPWMAGTFLTRHVCEKCNCHGKADECSFNQTVADLSLSLNIQGQNRGGGVCIGCRDNTTGINCQTCVDGYYRPAGPAVPGGSCQPCDCHGNLDLSTPGSCDPITGRCLRCRQGYGSASCDSCADGYHGDAIIPNCWWDAERQDCIPCRCSPHGSMSQRCDIEGRCICRPGFVGQRCDLRRQSYERRETRRPVERVPIEVAQQRWGGSSRTGGCPRGAYRPKTGVTHTARCV